MSQEARKKRVGRWVVVRADDGKQLRVLFFDRDRAEEHAKIVERITKFKYQVITFVGDANEIKP